jgi:TPR repeat protein
MDARTYRKPTRFSRHATDRSERKRLRCRVASMSVRAVVKRTPFIAGLKQAGRDLAKDLFLAQRMPFAVRPFDARLLMVICALGAAPAFAFDGTPQPAGQPVAAVTTVTPVEAFRNGANALKLGEKAKAITSLQYAAEQGHALAQWKLGRMYAEGDGVPRNDLRAFEYFRRIADSHAEDAPDLPQARFVANAFVQLGHYYLDGIPNSAVKADPARAREMYSYAASYFGDADAQYSLGKLLLKGRGGAQEPRQAVRWLWLAANKGQCQAQALLGSILFKGEITPRQAARGLMWLTLARENCATVDAWIKDAQEAANRQANNDERSMALLYLERYIKGQRD